MPRYLTLFWRAVWTVLLLHSWPSVLPETISYAYDPAGRLVAVDYGGGQSISYAYDGAGNLVQASAPSPGLAFGPVANGQFTIAWPATPGGFVLESAPSLAPNAVWTPVAAQGSAVGGRMVVTLQIGPATTFYRLHR